MTKTAKILTATCGLLLVLVTARMGQSSSTSVRAKTTEEPAPNKTATRSARERPTLAPPTRYEAAGPTFRDLEANEEDEDLPTAVFESAAADSVEFVAPTEEGEEGEARLAKQEEEARVIHEENQMAEDTVDPASEGFDSIEEMEAFVRESFAVPSDTEIRFSKAMEGDEERLSIAFVPRG